MISLAKTGHTTASTQTPVTPVPQASGVAFGDELELSKEPVAEKAKQETHWSVSPAEMYLFFAFSRHKPAQETEGQRTSKTPGAKGIFR